MENFTELASRLLTEMLPPPTKANAAAAGQMNVPGIPSIQDDDTLDPLTGKKTLTVLQKYLAERDPTKRQQMRPNIINTLRQSRMQRAKLMQTQAAALK